MPTRIEPRHVVLRDESFRMLRLEPEDSRASLARLATVDTPFLFVGRESDALTLLLTEQAERELGDLLCRATAEDNRYRVITFTPTLPWDLIGFLACISTLLADNAIPLGAISTFDRDSLFVRADLAEQAAKILREAASEGRLG